MHQWVDVDGALMSVSCVAGAEYGGDPGLLQQRGEPRAQQTDRVHHQAAELR